MSKTKDRGGEIVTTVYIVHRASADGLEQDVFTDYSLARRWADYTASDMSEEPVIDMETINDMRASYDLISK